MTIHAKGAEIALEAKIVKVDVLDEFVRTRSDNHDPSISRFLHPLAEQFGLKKVHADLGDMRMPIWLVTHADGKTNARIRLCFDLIAETLKAFQTGKHVSFEKRQAQ